MKFRARRAMASQRHTGSRGCAGGAQPTGELALCRIRQQPQQKPKTQAQRHRLRRHHGTQSPPLRPEGRQKRNHSNRYQGRPPGPCSLHPVPGFPSKKSGVALESKMATDNTQQVTHHPRWRLSQQHVPCFIRQGIKTSPRQGIKTSPRQGIKTSPRQGLSSSSSRTHQQHDTSAASTHTSTSSTHQLVFPCCADAASSVQ